MTGLEFLILGGLINVGTALIQGGLQSHEQKKARDESKSIAMQNRSDILAQRGENNKLAERKLSLNDRSIAFDGKMLRESMKDTKALEGKLEKQRDAEFLTQSVKKFDQDRDQKLNDEFSGKNRRTIGRVF